MKFKISILILLFLTLFLCCFVGKYVVLEKADTTYEAYNLTSEAVEAYRKEAPANKESAEKLYKYYLYIKKDDAEARKWEVMSMRKIHENQ